MFHFFNNKKFKSKDGRKRKKGKKEKEEKEGKEKWKK